MQGLYAILDTHLLNQRGLEVLPVAEAVLSAKPAALQLRDKMGGARHTLALLRALSPLCTRAGVPLFANDRPDLALLAHCEGVHLGQDDLPVTAARLLSLSVRADPPRVHRLWIGLSTHNQEQVDAALRDPIDYLAIGPVFATASKANPDPVLGLDVLSVLASHAKRLRPGMPLVAIGGITLESAGAVATMVDCVAVIGALIPEGAVSLDAIAERAKALQAAVTGGQA